MFIQLKLQYCVIVKVQLETITSQDNRSFSLMFNPRLCDLFFWHSHPEYELVYIKAPMGTRHVGDHISTFKNYDLVLIGSDIPHLNFDYGLKSEYKKVVVHFNRDFIEQHLASAPELTGLADLFEKSKKGVALKGSKVCEISEQLFDLEDMEPFEQYIALIKILRELTLYSSIKILHEYPYHNDYSSKDQERLRQVYALIDKNYHRQINLDEVAELCYMTREAFCRYFKKMTQYTFVQFLNRYRITHAKRYLLSGASVSEACYQSGFHSLSYFNRTFKKITGENPSQFTQRHS